MKNTCTFFLAWLIAFPALSAQAKEIGEADIQPTPEIKRLFEAVGGDWDTSEKRERTQFFPNGGERTGRSHVRLSAAGSTLVMEGHSDGSAGLLSYIISCGGIRMRIAMAFSLASRILAAAVKYAARRSGTGTNSSTITKRWCTAKRRSFGILSRTSHRTPTDWFSPG